MRHPETQELDTLNFTKLMWWLMYRGEYTLQMKKTMYSMHFINSSARPESEATHNTLNMA